MGFSFEGFIRTQPQPRKGCSVGGWRAKRMVRPSLEIQMSAQLVRWLSYCLIDPASANR
jgi:hypothetical protein